MSCLLVGESSTEIPFIIIAIVSMTIIDIFCLGKITHLYKPYHYYNDKMSHKLKPDVRD